MNKGFFADVLAARPLLWEAMIRADCAGCGPASSAGELAECAEKIGGASLRTWLLRPLRRHGAEGETSSFWDYAEESRRLALLAGSDLDALCRVAGAALHAPEIARTLRREEVLALRHALGEELYRYALHRGQYQLGGVRRLFARLHPSLPLAERCALHGSMALRLVASGWPAELARRFFSKFPDAPLTQDVPEFGEAEIRDVWIALKKLLLKEVAPAWTPCFD